MNVLQAIFICSLVVSTVGFHAYMYEYLCGYVDRYTRWSELTTYQWICFGASLQVFAVGPLLLLWRCWSATWS